MYTCINLYREPLILLFLSRDSYDLLTYEQQAVSRVSFLFWSQVF